MLKKALIGLIIVAMLVPTINAATFDDQWFIDNAEIGVENDYNLPESTWKGTVTTDWHKHGTCWHKHVDLTTKYSESVSRGYKYINVIEWSGRSYAQGGIYTLEYSHTRTRYVPSLQLKTTVKNPQYRYIWNGKAWIENPNTESYWQDGRFWVVYPKPE